MAASIWRPRSPTPNVLREYPLFWYEEAGDPLDFALQAALAEFLPAPMATGENLFSHQDARNPIRYGGMRPDRDWLQFDCALSYGPANIGARFLAVADAQMVGEPPYLRTAVTRCRFNIAAGLGLGGNESYPDLFQPYGGFDGVRVENGHITMPDLPGIGFEGKSDFYAEMTALAA